MAWASILETLATVLLVPLATWAASALTAYLKQKTANESLIKYFNLANDAITTAVSDTMQTFVSTVKNSGEWNTDAAATALRAAKTKARDLMGAATYTVLGEIVSDADAWLTSKVEAAVLTVRHDAVLLGKELMVYESETTISDE